MNTGLWLVGGLIVLLFLYQRQNLKRLAVAVGAQFGKVFKWVWGIDPIAVYQAEVDRSTQEIQSAGEGLEQYRGLVSRLERQVANGDKEEARLIAKVKMLIASNDDAKAAEYAVQLQKVQRDNTENKSQLEAYKATYDNNLKKVKFANQKIREAKDKAEKMQAELRLSKAEAETAKLARQFNVKTATLDGLGEIEDEIQRQIDANRAKGQVIRDMSQDGLDELAEQEKVQQAEAMEMLEKFKLEMKK